MPEEMSYKKSGVDIDAGNKFAKMIRERVKKVWGQEAANELVGFGGGAKIPQGATGFNGGIDGAGTMAYIAALLGEEKYIENIGYGAAVMSLGDVYCATGMPPTALWDQITVGKLRPKLISIIDGIILACREAGCVLRGGETAEHSKVMYKHSWIFDVATMALSFTNNLKTSFWPIRKGDKLYGWPSLSVGMNGASLIREVFGLNGSLRVAKERLLTSYSELCNLTLAEVLLQRTPLWIRDIENKKQEGVKFGGHAHITGGGIIENLSRVIPRDFKAVINKGSWQRPHIFRLIQETGSVSEEEMVRTFNNGLMVISIQSQDGADIGEKAFYLGEIETRKRGEPKVQLVGNFKDHYN